LRASGLSVVLSLGVCSCAGPQGHVDLIGTSIEESADELRSLRGQVREVEVYSGESGPWTVVIVPLTGLDYDALARSGLEQAAIERLKGQASKLRDGQCIVQIRRDAVLIRPVAIDLVRIDKQFVLFGRETTRIVAKVKGAAHGGKPSVTDFYTKEP
jgi:hypothetical protein